MDENKNKYLLGLTGSIGMGKSTAAKMFVRRGFSVWDADAAVHDLYSLGGSAVEPIRSLFPDAVKNGFVDRPVLAAWLMASGERIEKLEEIVHPLVAAHRKNFIQTTENSLQLFDIPLLFETGADEWLSSVAVVTTDAETQKNRVMEREGMTQEKLALILDRQLPDSEKRKRADHLIFSDTLESAEKCVNDIVEEIRGRMDA